MISRGVSFGDIHSHYDLDLLLSAVEISPATAKTTYIDIPGADGFLDLTEANGEVRYSDRSMKFTFSMNPMSDLSESAWVEKMSEICNKLAGKRCKITLDKDPEYYWEGRVSVDSFKSNKRVRQFVVSAKVMPYKLKKDLTVVSFDLEPGSMTYILKNARRSVCPEIETFSATTDIVFAGNTFTFGKGTHKNLDIRLVEGDNELIMSGTGKIAFTYQEADL